jgi:hypothetical protein
MNGFKGAYTQKELQPRLKEGRILGSLGDTYVALSWLNSRNWKSCVGIRSDGKFPNLFFLKYFYPYYVQRKL